MAAAALGTAPAPLDLRATPSEGESRPGEAGPEHGEYQVKALFLLNFIRYTTWPAASFADERAPIVLTVVGRDPFGSALEKAFEGERVQGRSIVVARTRELPSRLGGHVVFCADLSRAERAALIQACRRRPLLLVGETPGFAEDGAGINFYLADKKTRFEVNTDALAEASLVVSPAVLKLARIVKGRREDGR